MRPHGFLISLTTESKWLESFVARDVCQPKWGVVAFDPSLKVTQLTRKLTKKKKAEDKSSTVRHVHTFLLLTSELLQSFEPCYKSVTSTVFLKAQVVLTPAFVSYFHLFLIPNKNTTWA